MMQSEMADFKTPSTSLSRPAMLLMAFERSVEIELRRLSLSCDDSAFLPVGLSDSGRPAMKA